MDYRQRHFGFDRKAVCSSGLVEVERAVTVHRLLSSKPAKNGQRKPGETAPPPVPVTVVRQIVMKMFSAGTTVLRARRHTAYVEQNNTE